jgi:hypothetical protein
VCDIQVRLKNDALQADYDAAARTDGLTIIPGEPLAVTSYSANVSFPSTTGTPIFWTATTTGGVNTPQLQYQFWLRDPVSPVKTGHL